MSNRDSLRKLSKLFPEADEVSSIMESLRSESDHTVAIVGASLVESALEHLLIASFKSKSAETLPRVFDNRGPLSDFNSKILIAQVFGVISDNQALELQRIRHIRNVFAHARVSVKFENAAVSKEVTEFIMLLAMVNEGIKQGESAPFSKMSRKDAYLLICKIMMIMLDSQHRKLGGRPLLSG